MQPGTIDDIVYWDTASPWWGVSRLRLLCAGRKFDMAFVLPFSGERFVSRFKKYVLLRLAGIHCPVYGVKSPKTTHPLPQVFAAMGALDEARIPINQGGAYKLYVNEEDHGWVEENIRARGWGGKQIISVFPAGTYVHKRWPSENFVELLDRVVRSQEVKIVFIGTASEGGLANEIIARMQCNKSDVWVACGETNLQQLAALLARSTVFVGNDGGPAHLAAAVGIPCVTLMSGVHPAGVWDPFGPKCVSIRESVPCEACLSELSCPQKNPICITRISISRVEEVVLTLLQKARHER